MSELSILGAKVTSEQTQGRLECFPRPKHTHTVNLHTDEVYASCPITGQPDFYTLNVTYAPRDLCVESKAFKLYVQTLATLGIFGESLASKIAQDVLDATRAYSVDVELIQKPRGGISITSSATAYLTDGQPCFEVNDEDSEVDESDL